MPKSLKAERKETFSVATRYEEFYTGGVVQFTKDGKSMLCMCGEQVKVVCVDSGKTTQCIGAKEDEVELTSFVLADDDIALVTAGKNSILKHWDLKDGNLLRTWKSLHVGRVACMTFDPTSTLLATGGSDSTIKVWDIHKKYCTHNLKGAQGVFSTLHFQVFGGSLSIFGAADDCKIHVWNLDTSKRVLALEGHCSTVTGLLFIEERNRMISCGRDKVVILWDLDTCSVDGKPLRIIPVFEAIESVIYAPEDVVQSLASDSVGDDEKTSLYFITAGDKGVLRLWNAYSGKCLLSQENSLVAPPEDLEYKGLVITQAAYVPAIDAIGIVTFEHNIILHKLQDFSLMKQFVGFTDDVLDVKLMGKDDTFLAVATNSPHIKIFELSTFNCQLLKGHLDIVLSLDVFVQDCNMLVSASKDNSVRVWKMNAETHEVHCVFMGYGHTHSVGSVACSRGKSKFFVSGSQDSTLKLWDIPSKVPVVSLKLSLSARCTVVAHGKTINSAAVSCNNKFVATGSQDSTAKVWDSSDLSLLGTMRGHKKGVWCVVFSPIDLVLATSSGDGTIKVWSLSEFSVLKTFEGHYASVFNVQFLTRGTQLVTSASDGLLKLWDIKNNECMKTFDGHSDKVWALTVSSEEEFIVSGAADSKIVIWKDATNEEKEKRMLQQEEFVLREQELSNFMKKKKWTKALQLSVLLDQPSRALNIINEILLEPDGRTVLEETIMKMQQYEIESLLKFAIEWNTNSKYYWPAQLILKAILKTYTTEELLKFPDRRATIESLLPYAERHYQRLTKMVQDAHILPFLLDNMKVTAAEQNEISECITTYVEGISVCY